jgi:uncharacterized protein
VANRVVHFEIPAKDVKRASEFYEKAFGWNVNVQGEEYGGYVLVNSGPQVPSNILESGINGGIYKEEGSNENVRAFRCVIGVADIDKAITDVKAAGGKILHIKSPDGKDLGEKTNIPNIGFWSKCEDTEGNIFSLMQPDLASMMSIS